MKKSRLKKEIAMMEQELIVVQEELLRMHEAYVGWKELQKYYEERDEDDDWPF